MSEAVSPKFVSIVATLDEVDQSPTAPVAVSFVDLPSVFYLQRDHSCFQTWVRMLRASRNEQRTIVFAHASVGMYIRTVESGDRITGIVEELFDEIQKTSVGFTIPNYRDIFLIPKNHPELQRWSRMLWKSHRERMEVLFAYDAHQRHVTSMALVDE